MSPSPTRPPVSPDPAEDRLISEVELAERQNRSVKTLQNDRLAGCGVPFVKLGRTVRYRLSDIIRYEQSHLRNSTSGPAIDEQRGRP